MYKFGVIFLAMLIFILTPLAGHALKALSDDELENVSGMAGLSVIIDDLAFDWDIGDIVIGDSNGHNGFDDSAGYFYISGLNTYIFI